MGAGDTRPCRRHTRAHPRVSPRRTLRASSSPRAPRRPAIASERPRPASQPAKGRRTCVKSHLIRYGVRRGAWRGPPHFHAAFSPHAGPPAPGLDVVVPRTIRGRTRARRPSCPPIRCLPLPCCVQTSRRKVGSAIDPRRRRRQFGLGVRWFHGALTGHDPHDDAVCRPIEGSFLTSDDDDVARWPTHDNSEADVRTHTQVTSSPHSVGEASGATLLCDALALLCMIRRRGNDTALTLVRAVASLSNLWRSTQASVGRTPGSGRRSPARCDRGGLTWLSSLSHSEASLFRRASPSTELYSLLCVGGRRRTRRENAAMLRRSSCMVMVSAHAALGSTLGTCNEGGVPAFRLPPHAFACKYLRDHVQQAST